MKMRENGGKSFFCPMDKNLISLVLNVVLKNVMFYAYFSSKLAHGTLSLCFVT